MIAAVGAWLPRLTITIRTMRQRSTSVPPPHVREDEGRRRLLECARRGIASGEKAQLRAALKSRLGEPAPRRPLAAGAAPRPPRRSRRFL